MEKCGFAPEVCSCHGAPLCKLSLLFRGMQVAARILDQKALWRPPWRTSAALRAGAVIGWGSPWPDTAPYQLLLPALKSNHVLLLSPQLPWQRTGRGLRPSLYCPALLPP